MLASTLKQSVPLAWEVITCGMKVVDCGCYGWRLADHCTRVGATLIGVDQVEPPNKPPSAEFAMIRDGVMSLPDGYADVVVASHIQEHVIDPVAFMQELMRVTRPGGLIWIEAPSELSAIPCASDDAEDHEFVNFWDDPTHIRPWTPGAMYRLALSCHCLPLGIGRCDAGGIPATRMLGRKPEDAVVALPSRYVSLRGVDPGVGNAWVHVWGERPKLPSFE